MLIPIKIQCGCGQRYAFDVEPVGGRMPAAVACPVCGVDGTENANVILSQRLGAGPAAPAIRAVIMETAAPAPVQMARAPAMQQATATKPAPAERRLLPGQMDPAQARHEARAKVFWGDVPEEVTKFLRMQGFSQEEALEVITPLYAERAATIRSNGIKKIFTGSGMALLPVIAFFVFRHLGVFPIKIFGATLVVGVWGVGIIIKGIIMVLAPKSEPGDVAEQ